MFNQIKIINLKFISTLLLAVTLLTGSFFLFAETTFATDGILSTKSFSVWNQGGIIGYDAGFSLTDATFNDSQSIVIKLYSGNTLLQTNTAINSKITGTEFLTPFDVFGTFDYKKDGYFTNIRGNEYGKVLAPTKVVATVTLTNGKVLTATNTKLTGDTNTIGVTPIVGQVLGTEKFHFTLPMKTGSRGNQVMELQKLLNTAGYESGVADGIFGPLTKTSLIKFQVANELTGDGIVGPLTRTVLNK